MQTRYIYRMNYSFTSSFTVLNITKNAKYDGFQIGLASYQKFKIIYFHTEYEKSYIHRLKTIFEVLI